MKTTSDRVNTGSCPGAAPAAQRKIAKAALPIRNPCRWETLVSIITTIIQDAAAQGQVVRHHCSRTSHVRLERSLIVEPGAA